MSTLQCLSPVDGSLYVERVLATESEIRAALDAAARAQPFWRNTPVADRIAMIRKAVEIFTEKKEQLGPELTWMMGRPIRFASGEILGFAERALYMAEIAESALADIRLPEKEGFERFIRREPLGISLVIAPWNYPYLTAVNAVVPSLLAGNVVLLKHSAQTPLCSERMVEAFTEAGLPTGVFQYLHLSHGNTERLISAAEVNHVAFTGSVPGGAMVERVAAGRFIQVGLELGGKDPAYIRKDADLEASVASAVDGAFFNSGQSCCGIERLYVHESLFDAVVERAAALVSDYRLGRPDDPQTTLGPLVRTAAADFVRGQVDEALSAGARAHIDPVIFPADRPGTPYVAPQLLTEVNHEMRVMREESFGPVLGVQPVRDDEEAIALMNDSDFGLTAAIYSDDPEAAKAIGDRLQTGTVFLNRCDYLDPALAWTGVKQSGRGCTLSPVGYEHLTRPKSFHLKKRP
ncbi:Succinate semialdehyde dehydrogenase [NAD(P)+] Sad [Microbulbifer aggregans]|uniref:Succinate semialdehyde dehydrogenase [NAD(P)+] Sad n=1 Tax=Microbulbifer aggregans TaxID=1769779 RepID=A0A1C9W7I7_9GAMM|nr:aldehyde dehydrogenase family protein [Microbulbifer aggregans]AOS97115.1 Succinate semialdehyde dehydrogenase [NAD(P)+] Sad [Microbulbifer aggregans]